MAIEYEPVIGLEVHAQLLTRSKLFCGCPAAYGAPPNTQVCPVCLGLPGSLPVVNKAAVELAIRAALALGCTVRNESRFARKNYFYPDLAKGYQISQYELPLNENGRLEFEVDGVVKQAGITRIHMEEDAAKNIHGAGADTDTLVDFNRAGVPLIEIVGAPDLCSAAEAEAYLRRLREVLMFTGVNDGNLEEGSFRCDANVSIRPRGSTVFGTRVELKNINSFRFVRKAIEYEITRQRNVIAAGQLVVQETRTWSEGQGQTLSMRSKEEAHDYRYFPDPDLPRLVVSDEMLRAVQSGMPELPEAMRKRFQEQLGLTAYDATVITSHPAVASFFEHVAVSLARSLKKNSPDAAIGKRVANFVQSEILRDVSVNGLQAEFPVTADHLAELLSLIEGGTISGKIAKDVLAEMVRTGRRPEKIVEQRGLIQVTDTGVIEAQVREIIQQNPAQVEKYRAGKTNVLGFFVGQVMRATQGKANPALVNDVLRKQLDQG